ARASNVAIDVRKNAPYAAYDLVDWSISTYQGGDIFAKAMVRVLELYQSIKIVNQCLNYLKNNPGEIDLKVKEIPEGEGIGRHEAPRGECFHYVRSDKTNRPVRHKIRAPSFMNVATNQKAVIGQHISDALLILAAVDPCYCCTERLTVIDKQTSKKVFSGQDLLRLSKEKTEYLRKKIL
ncbi:MAG: NADH:ubiquinone oxidoreductase, partial [Elusimicrobia bacterium]|nr:NADH:ubiquinone oxidoreductase [Elusimicrobiota bacterium]